jgi:hypothetical protein
VLISPSPCSLGGEERSSLASWLRALLTTIRLRKTFGKEIGAWEGGLPALQKRWQGFGPLSKKSERFKWIRVKEGKMPTLPVTRFLQKHYSTENPRARHRALLPLDCDVCNSPHSNNVPRCEYSGQNILLARSGPFLDGASSIH